MVALPEHIHNDGSTVDNYTTTSAAAFTGTSVAAASTAGGVARMKPQIIFVPNIFDNQRVHRLIYVARQSKSHWSTVTTAPLAALTHCQSLIYCMTFRNLSPRGSWLWSSATLEIPLTASKINNNDLQR